MHDYLERNGPVSEDLAKKWTRQLIEAVTHCHKRYR
jgi:serine/threonine protein kinase